MKIKKFRIKNFKSIIDSGDCYLEDDLTILAGKNESGKSSILEALNCFNLDKSISSNYINSQTEEFPEITLDIEFSKDEINDYLNSISSNSEAKDNIIISISKFYGEDEDYYDINNNKIKDFLELYDLDNQDERNNILNQAKTSLQKIVSITTAYSGHGLSTPIKEFKSFDDLTKIEKLVDHFKSNNFYSHILGGNNEIQINIDSLNEILKDLDNYTDKNDNWDEFYNLLPNLILFNSFDDIMPDQVKIKELESNEFIKDLVITTGLDTKIIKSGDDKNKIRHKDILHIKINKEYSKYWTQDNTIIRVDYDNEKLTFLIVEEDDFYSLPKDRSKGKQWHLSFYIRITARTISNKFNVLLIDEPGLFLHATAQRDIYNKLIDTAKNNQIIFSTHSPYLINENELHRIRLIEKKSTKKGTKIQGKYYSKSDYETLTPIMTAIGLELNSAIQDINKKYNIVCEGQSDLYYLQAFSILEKSNINFINGVSSAKMGVVGSILQGWGTMVLYLFDNDQGKKDGQKNLLDNFHVEKHQILTVIDEKDKSIEDIFSITDFKKHIIEDENENIDNISKYIKSKKSFDKVLRAKLFLSKVKHNKIKLNNETLNRIKAIFTKIEKGFKELE